MLCTLCTSPAWTQESAGMPGYFAQICLQNLYIFFYCIMCRPLQSFIQFWTFTSTLYIKIISKYEKIVCKYLNLLEFQIPAFRSLCKAALYCTIVYCWLYRMYSMYSLYWTIVHYVLYSVWVLYGFSVLHLRPLSETV